MLFKAFVIAILLTIVASLGMGLYHLITGGSRSDKTVKALTYRIALSVALFVLLMLGVLTGLIRPHGGP